MAARRLGRTLRTRVAPWVIWLLTISAAGWLWYDGRSNLPVVGYADGVEYQVSAARQGAIARVSVRVGQEVAAGQVIAVLSSRELEAQIDVLEAELERTKAARGAARVQLERDQQRLVGRLDEAIAQTERDRVEASQRRSIQGARLKALRARQRKVEKLLAENLVRRSVTDDRLAIELAGARAQVGAAQPEAAILKKQIDMLMERRAAIASAAHQAAMLRPHDASIVVIERRLDRLKSEREQLVVRAPTNGTIAQILLRRGSVVAAGNPIVTMMGADGASKVVACLDESRATSAPIGSAVEVTPRGTSLKLRGKVVALAPRVGALPVQCRLDPRVEIWGRKVMIALDEPTALVSGQRFVVTFDNLQPLVDAPQHARASRPAPKPTRTSGEAMPVGVPPALNKLSRLEASGLTWVHALDRYVVVSDDTGHKRTNEGAPWLFTMDRKGMLDPSPLQVTGVEAWSDLEGIAPGRRGGLWVLASNSASSKGKRPKKRQVFAHLLPQSQRGFAVSGMVYLWKLLATVPSEQLGKLGITRESLNRINFEGLAAHPAGGLLIGLKAPLDDQGRALIWHVRYPKRLVDQSSLAAGELTRWAAVALKCSDRAGTQHAAGVAELLWLPDGGLLVAATTSDSRKRSQAGALWHIRDPTVRDGVLSAAKWRAYPALKPEGLALTPDGNAVAVVFDLGNKEPMWAELPWPRR